MLRIFLFCSLFALVACAKNPEQRLLAGQATLEQSLRIEQDTIIWAASAEAPGLIIDSQEPVVLDFGGARVLSSTFGESPENYTGLAILLRQSPSVTIRNATFCGFETGILAEAVGQIHLENCQFIDFRRGVPAPSVAVQLQQASSLKVERCRFQHLGRAFQFEAAVDIQVQQSAFHWLNAQVLEAAQKSRGSFVQNTFFYIGLAGREERAFGGGTFAFRQNHWAHVLRSGLTAYELTEQDNQAAYLPELKETQWSEVAIATQLRELGVSAPGLHLQDEQGWYDFSYPRVWLRESGPEKDIYLLTAPNGNWRLIGGSGYEKIVPKTGSFPTTLQAFRSTANAVPSLAFEYLGEKIRKYGVHPVQISPIPFSTDQ
jgi:hypothetical protein